MGDEIQKIKSGELKLHNLEAEFGPKEALKIRKEYLTKIIGFKIENISKSIIDPEKVYLKNIENLIGSVQLPLGVAGPLKVKGKHAKGEFFIPIATTEGALVASVNRGASCITKSGGCSVAVTSDCMTRAPAFHTNDLDQSLFLVQWAKDHFNEIKQVAESTTRFGKLQEIQPYIAGTTVFLRFVYTSGDAAGLNMVTVATDKASAFIEEKTGIPCIALSGNMCTDKKAAAMNLIKGRGKTVTAHVKVPREIVEKVLKTTPERIVNTNYAKNFIGSALAGSLGGFNAHAANMIAGIFISCGQDPAEVVESSMCITSCQLDGDELSFSVTLPSLEIGTVGGGTTLPCQSECLNLMGCAGAGDPPGSNSMKFAEIIASAVLAGELSLVAALSAGHLAGAHEKLGRKKS